MYFGKNAVYIVELPIKNEYSLESLTKLLQDKNIRYIFQGEKIDHRLFNLNFPLPGQYRNWFRNEKISYSLEKDLEIIQAYIRSKGGLVINKNRFGKIYYLSGEEIVQKQDLIANGSFEHWWKGLPMGEWKLVSGWISRAVQATEGSSSIRFEPDDKKESRIIRTFENLYKNEERLRVRMDI